MKKVKHLSKFFGLSIFTGILVFQLHELGHFFLGSITGLDISFRISHVVNLTENATTLQLLIFNLGGPLITFLLALASIFLLIKKYPNSMMLSTFALGNSWLRFWATKTTLQKQQLWQDEYQIAKILEINGDILTGLSLSFALIIFFATIYYSKPARILKIPVSIIGIMIGASIVNVAANL